MCYLFPAIIHRLDSYMISLDLTRSLHLPCITPALALEAVTKDSDNTDEHRLAQLSFQRGMGHNYERLEFIGDCFLKLATTISLYVNVPDHAEFEYHVRRMCMICNENLFKVAKDLNVPEFVRSQGFNRRRWYPAGMKLLKGKGAGKDEDGMTHGLGDKTVADVCEAIIGAALVSGREKADFDSAVRAVTTFVKNPDHSFDSFSEYFSAYKRPDYVNHDSSASILDLAEQIYSVHPYRFKYPRLLRSAFTHPSMPTSLEKIPNYQRLEFLGDALLDLCIVNYLYHDPRFANRDPQWLTEHKMAMVSNRFFSALAVQLGFHRHLRYMGAVIEGQNRTYVQALKEAESEAKLQAERAGAGMEKSWMNYWNSVSAAPKCLSDLIESYVGAIFVDSEFSMAVVESFFEMHIKPWFLDMSLYDTYASGNPITLVTTNLANTYGCENFRILMKEIPASPYSVRDGKVEDVGAKCVVAIMVHETVLAKGMGNTGGRYAKERACKQGLKALAEMTDGMDEGPERIRIFRQKYGCDCRKGETMLAAAG